MWPRRVLFGIVAFALLGVALGTTYVVAQQAGRSMAEDAPRTLLSNGVPPTPGQHLDLSTSLSVFWVEFNSAGRPVAGDAFLNGALPQLPLGVLATARSTGQDAVTWQPAPNLRFAVVAEKVGDHVLVAGQSLQRTEHRADTELVLTLLGMVAGAILIVAVIVVEIVFNQRRPNTSA